VAGRGCVEETPQREPCGCQPAGPHGGVAGGVSAVPYHPPALPPGHRCPRPARRRRHRQPDHRGADRVVGDRPDPAGRAAHPDTREAPAARPLPRRPQPAAAQHAPVDPDADQAAGRLDPACQPAGVAVPGRGGGGEGLRQAAAVGGVDLLVRQQAQGLRHAHRGGAVVQRRRRRPGSRSRFACGGPGGPAPQPPTRPSCSWPRACAPSWSPPSCRSPTW
jgi:hypothetical protein